MYKCSNCNGTMDRPLDRCPHCGVILSGVRCENCKYLGTKQEFISNNNRCPKCNSVVHVPISESIQEKGAQQEDVWISLNGCLLIVGSVLLFCVLVYFGVDAYSKALAKKAEKRLGFFIDPRDNHTYKTTNIGTQTWMAENLQISKDNYGNSITLIRNPSDWSSINYDDTACYYLEQAVTQGYGLYYTFYAAKVACPAGWHLPSDEEWKELIEYLGEKSAGRKLKTYGRKTWRVFNFGANNRSGFSALPGGFSDEKYGVLDLKWVGYWWTSTEDNNYNAWAVTIGGEISALRKNTYNKDYGLSVRCIKD